MLTGVRFAIAFAIAAVAPAGTQAATTPLHRAPARPPSSIAPRPALARTLTQRAPQLLPARAPNHASPAPPTYNPLVRRHMALPALTVSDLAR